MTHIDIGDDLAAALRVLGKRVPRNAGERPSYDHTLRWLLRTHPGLSQQVVDERTG